MTQCGQQKAMQVYGDWRRHATVNKSLKGDATHTVRLKLLKKLKGKAEQRNLPI